MTTFHEDTGLVPVSAELKARLPDKPSGLIRVAIKDMQNVLARDEPGRKYELDMSTWHEYYSRSPDPKQERIGICQVCFAGSVMAGSLECEFDDDLEPFDFDDARVRQKLLSLNLFRKGDVILGLFAFYELKLTTPDASDPLVRLRVLTENNLPPIPPNKFYMDIKQPSNRLPLLLPRFYAEMEEMAAMLESCGH